MSVLSNLSCLNIASTCRCDRTNRAVNTETMLQLMDACAGRQRGIYIILNTRWGSGSQFLTVSVITEEELDQQMEIEK